MNNVTAHVVYDNNGPTPFAVYASAEMAQAHAATHGGKLAAVAFERVGFEEQRALEHHSEPCST